MRVVKVGAWTVGALIVLAIAVYATGWLTPEAHVAQVGRDLTAPPEQVWSLIREFEQSASWRPTVHTVTVIGHKEQRAVFEETGDLGQVRYIVESEQPPRQLVTRIVDNQQFGGTWTYRVTAITGGSRLEIVENGVIYDPMFRFFARFVFGFHSTLEAYADALEAEVGRT